MHFQTGAIFAVPSRKVVHAAGFHRKPIFKKEDQKEAQIPIQLNGFDKIFSSGVSKFRRILWFLVMASLLAVSTLQMYNCFYNFSHQPIAVTVHFVENSTIKPPLIILCPLILTRNVKLVDKFWNKNGTVSASELYGLVGRGVSAEEIWEVSDMVADDLALHFIEGLSLVDYWIIDESPLQEKKINSLSGKCSEIHATRELHYNGLYTYIRIRDPDLPYEEGIFLQVLIKDESINHVDRLFVARQGVIIPLHAQVNLYYKLEEHIYLDTSKNPCASDEEISKCINKCIDREFYEQPNVKCRLPFMDRRHGFKVCSTPDQFHKTFEAADRLMREYSLDFCKCPRHCYDLIYQLSSASELHVDEHISLNLNIFFSENFIERVEEYPSYGYTSLLADVGGTLGLYLGVCIITFIEILEMITLKLLRVVNAKF